MKTTGCACECSAQTWCATIVLLPVVRQQQVQELRNHKRVEAIAYQAALLTKRDGRGKLEGWWQTVQIGDFLHGGVGGR